jgi:hypothetical protein
MTDLTIVNDKGESADEAEQRRAERDAMTIEELDASNEQRLGALMSGALGMKVQMQPGMFENIRTLTLLEAIVEHLGLKDAANKAYAVKAAGVLDNFEGTVRMAVIKSGVGPQPIDLSDVATMQGQIAKNREERRAKD